MGANAQTAVPAFTAGQVLTAAQQTQINTGIPVFATTVTRDAAFDGTGEKVLAEGQFAYIEATNTTQYYDGAAWQSVGGSSGLTLISTTTIGTTVSSVTVTGAFSATYENYRISVTGGVGSTLNYLNLTLGSTTTGYYRGTTNTNYNATASSGGAQNGASFQFVASANTNSMNGQIEIQCPNLAKNTHFFTFTSTASTTGDFSLGSGYLADTTQYTAFTLTTSTGTVTGGTIKVYGYANS